MMGCRIVESTLAAGLGIAARPGRGVNGEHQRPVRWGMRHQQVAHLLDIEAASGECLVEAAMTAPELRLQTQRRYRPNRRSRTQDRITELESGIGPTGPAAVQTRTETTQLLDIAGRARSGVVV